jgi:tetratricopeptide (TPR) repeat protein
MAINKQKVLKNATKFTKKGQHEKAINEYRKLTQEDFGETSLSNIIGDLLTQAGRVNQALVEYEKAGQYYEEKGFIPKALAIYKKVLRHDPKIPRIYEKLAQLYSDQGLIQDAITQYEFLAKHFEHEGKTEDALDAYRQIADLDPSNLAIRERLALLYSQQGFTEKACAERVKIGERYVKRGDTSTAIKNFEVALQEVEGNEAALRGIVSVYLAEKRTDEAVEVLNQLLKKNPENISALSTLGRVYMDAGMLDEAIEIFNKVFQLDPTQEGVNEILGRIYILRGNYPEAFKRLKEIINVSVEREEYDRALGILDQLQGIEAGNISIREKKIEIYQKLDRDEDLKVSFKELAEIYYEKGRLEEAYNIYERLFSMDPHESTVKQRFNQISIELRGRPIEIGKLVEQPKFETVLEDDAFEEKDLLEIGVDSLAMDEDSNTLESLFDTSEIEKISMPVFTTEDADGDDLTTDGFTDEIFTLEEEEGVSTDTAIADVGDDAVPTTDQLREYRIEAGVFMKYGLLEKAVERLSSILEMVPDDDESLEKLSEVYLRMGDIDQSVQSSIKRSSNLQHSGDLASAVSILKDALQQIPDNELLLEKLQSIESAEDVVQLGDTMPYTAVKKDLSDVSDFEPLVDLDAKPVEADLPGGGDTEALADLEIETSVEKSVETGETLSDGLAEVVKEFREELVSRHETKDVETHYNLGIAYREMGLLDEAIEEFKLTLDFPSHVVEGADLLAMCYLDKGEAQKAITLLNKVMKSDDLTDHHRLTLKYDLGLVHKAAGNLDEAKTVFNEIKKIDKSFRDVGKQIKELGK